jgi:hypothetical protein
MELERSEIRIFERTILMMMISIFSIHASDFLRPTPQFCNKRFV